MNVSMKNRLILSAISLCLFCLLMFSYPPVSNAETLSGACGVYLDWTLDAGGTLTITGTGPMDDYTSASPAPWAGRKDTITRVILDYGVTSVGRSAFEQCFSLTDIQFPDSLRGIGDYAFFYCTALRGVSLPADLERIGSSAFSYCRKLASIDIPGTITTVSAEAFRKTGVTDVIIREGVTKIDEFAFYGTPLTQIELPASLEAISASAFGNCNSLATVQFSGTLEEADSLMIGAENTCLSTALWHCSDGDTHAIGPTGGACGEGLTWALDSDGTLTISGAGSMDDYTSASGAPWEIKKGLITRVVLTEGVTAVGNHAFHGCGSLAEAVLPDGLLSLGSYAFYLCPSLTSVVLPDTVTSIGPSCFEQCVALTDVQLPASLELIDQYAFSYCTELRAIDFPAGLKTIGQSAFSLCRKLSTVKIPSGIATVSMEAFQDSGITNLILSDGITEIDGYAFCSTPLKHIQLPASVRTIAGSAFGNCEALTTVTYLGTRDEAMSMQIGGDNAYLETAAWQYLSVPQDHSGTFTLPSDLNVIGSEAFDGTAAEVVVIPASVQVIESGAFDHCDDLLMLVFEGSPAQIAADALGSRTDVIISVIPGSTAEAWAMEQHFNILYH